MGDERQLGSGYVLERPLGEGASGQVWLGRDRTGRPRAVKLLRHELASDSSVLQRFVQERSVLESIHHPHVVQVHDLVVEGGTLAIVMDYVEGEDLATALAARGTYPPAEAAQLGYELATALHAAHLKGVVHRDVKPANVLIESATGQARLSDFGIAKIADTAQRRTMLLGTPLYMAPELAAGADPTPAADVYSLGLLLYELLCGVPAFAGRPSSLAVLGAHATELPGRPEGIPDSFWDLLMRMVAKGPAQRGSAASVADSLRSVAAQCRDLPAAPRLSEPPPTTVLPGVAGVAGVAGAAGVVGGSGGGGTVSAASQTAPAGSLPPGADRAHQETSLGTPYGSPVGPAPYGGPGAAGGYPPTAYPQGAYPQAGYPPGAYPQAGYPPAGSPQGAYPHGAYPPAAYPAPPRPEAPAPRKNRAALVALAVVGLLALGAGAVALGMRFGAQASSPQPAAAATSTTSTGGVVPAPAPTTAATSAPPVPAAPTTVTAAPTPAAPAPGWSSPSQREADGAVMDYTARFTGGSLSAGDMATLFTPTVNWYGTSTSRGALYGTLSGIDMATYRQTYEAPRFTSFVAPTTYQGLPAAQVAYYVAYHKPGDSGAVRVTYTVVREADGQSRITAVAEQPL